MYCEELLEIVWINFCYKETSAKSGIYLAREHFRITAGNKDGVFGIGHTSCKLIPIVNVLYFIEKQHGTLAVHLLMTF